MFKKMILVIYFISFFYYFFFRCNFKVQKIIGNQLRQCANPTVIQLKPSPAEGYPPIVVVYPCPPTGSHIHPLNKATVIRLL